MRCARVTDVLALTFKQTDGEKIMEKNKVLKAIISASAAALVFGALPVSAQTSATSSGMQSGATATDPAVNGATQSGSTQSGMSQSGMSQSGQSGAAGATGSSSALTAADKKGLIDMATANMNEIAAGKIAVSKSQNADVKAYAQQMIDDHGKSLTEVQALAQTKGVTLPAEPDAKHKAMAAKLEKLSGADFDKEYMKNGGLADHKAVHATLMKDAKAAKDPDVKALATKTLPVVEQHLKSAQTLTAKK
jgi:predicted outer membrane protein